MKKFLRSPVVTGLMFLIALALLVTGSIGTTQAALQIRSENHVSTYALKHIGVTLRENGNAIAYRNYGSKAASGFTEVQNGNIVLSNLGSDKQVKVGKQYPCAITAQNTGTIDQYVRVTIRKYWVKDVGDPGGKGWFKFNSGSQTKITDDIYNPAYILLNVNAGDAINNYNETNWYRGDSPSKECEVYYYKGILKPNETTAPLFNYLAISNDISMYKDKIVKVTTEGNTTIYTYAFDGYGFVIEAEVDAVQTHHARAAMISAWGTDVNVMNQIGLPNE